VTGVPAHVRRIDVVEVSQESARKLIRLPHVAKLS
jgi:hypothetical protein